MATGAGKTGLFGFLILVACAISHDPSLALQGRTFPKNPCPTKALEEDMARDQPEYENRYSGCQALPNRGEGSHCKLVSTTDATTVLPESLRNPNDDPLESLLNTYIGRKTSDILKLWRIHRDQKAQKKAE
ncbi:hypothetical protein BYT27DRAFT_7252632 [Phlegmacium glaucopus]|nr:hypothetical protein BYT27DRAFT_7252632 [Phlegmacium glaucopus]